MRGFGVRVSYGGKKVFVVRYRVNGRLRRMTIGPYPDLSLADARRKARMVMGDVAHGDDPAQEKIERRQVLTFRDLAREYAEMAQKRHKRGTEEKRIVEKDLVPVLGHRLLTDIRRRDIRDLVEDIANKRNAPAMANRTLGMLSRLFNYALDRDWIESSPASRIKEPGIELSRDRVLTDDEIRELCNVLEQLAPMGNADAVEVSPAPSTKPIRRVITPATAQAFQVQLLTGQRPGEVRDMKWSQVDLETGWWTLPAAATKNGKAHRVPLTEWAPHEAEGSHLPALVVASPSRGADALTVRWPLRQPRRWPLRRERSWPTAHRPDEITGKSREARYGRGGGIRRRAASIGS